MLGIAITGLLAAFMAGVAANVTAFNTVVSYDLWQAYVRKAETEDTSAEQDPAERVWWRRPGVLGGIALALTALLYLVFVF
jgi:hypothetical protein